MTLLRARSSLNAESLASLSEPARGFGVQRVDFKSIIATIVNGVNESLGHYCSITLRFTFSASR